MKPVSEQAAAYEQTRLHAINAFEDRARETVRREIRGAYHAGREDEMTKASRPEELAPLARAARDAERKRIRAILEAPEAQGRDALAAELAYGTDMGVEVALKALEAAPKERSRVHGAVPRAMVDSALRKHGIDPSSVSLLNDAMEYEHGRTRISNQPAPDPAAQPGLNAAAIFAARRRAAQAGRMSDPETRPAA